MEACSHEVRTMMYSLYITVRRCAAVLTADTLWTIRHVNYKKLMCLMGASKLFTGSGGQCCASMLLSPSTHNISHSTNAASLSAPELSQPLKLPMSSPEKSLRQ